MTVHLDIVGDGITLTAPSTHNEVVRQIPGVRWDSKARTWRLPLTWAAAWCARAVLQDKVTAGPALRDWLAAYHAETYAPAMALRTAADAPGNPKLYPFQRVGVAFMNQAGSALNADEMGTGKTVQTVVALDVANSFPALVVCPNSVRERAWLRGFTAWAPHRRVAVAGNGTETAKKAVAEVANGLADVLVVNWEALRSLSRLAPYGSIRLESCSNCDPLSKRRPDLCQREDKALNLVHWAAVVADEAHHAKTPATAQTRALWALGDRADRRIALTGTPITDTAEDLWPIMRFVSPAEFPVKGTWIDLFALTAPNIFSGGVDILGLRDDTRPYLDRFLLPRYIRRLKAEVLPDLPPKVYEQRAIVLSGKQKKAYDQLAKEMVAQIQDGTVVAQNALVASLRLRQLASAYGTVITTEGDDPERQVLLAEPSSKLDELVDVLAELGPTRQAVLFAESSQLIELAYARITGKTNHTAARITGTTPQHDRDVALKEFEGGMVQLLLITTGAGGEGLDGLQVADVAIFLQRPWSAVANKQAEDRLHRIGQTGDSVLYIDLVATGTIEERVFEALERKEQALHDVMGDPV